MDITVRATRCRGEWHSDGSHLSLIAHGVLAAWIPGGTVRIWDKKERQWIRDSKPIACTDDATERVMVLAVTLDRDRDTEDFHAANAYKVAPKPKTEGAVDVIERGRRCLEAMDASIGGAGGAGQFFKAACALVRGLSLSVEEAMPLLLEYDARSSPRWGMRECRRALRNAKFHSRVPQGAMLKGKSGR